MNTKQENSKLKHISIKSIIHVFILKFETPFVDHAMTATKNTRDRSISFSTTVIVIATIATAATIAQASTSLCPLIYGSHHRRSSFFIFFLISLSLSLSLSPLCLSWPATMARSALLPLLTSMASISSPLLK